MTKRALVCLVVAIAGTGAAARAGGSAQLPNLVPLPPRSIGASLAEDGSQRLTVRFTVTTQNLGAYPLELLAVKPVDPAVVRQAAEQCVGWAGPRACIERAPAGDLVWHDAHKHWHFEDYALYEVRALLPDGSPDFGDAGLIAPGGKASFCLIDYESTAGAPGFPEDPFARTGYYQLCAGAFQGISAGWADTYEADLPGQQILMDGVPAGSYALVITADPDGRIAETDDGDNVSYTVFDWT